MYDLVELGREEQQQFIPKSADKTRMLIDFKRTEAFESHLNALQLDRLRFPSFESTIGTQFQRMLHAEDDPLALIEDRSFFNELKFDLESDAKRVLSNQKLFSETEKKVFWSLITSKVKSGPCSDRKNSIMRYKLKKQRRKMAYKIRYKVRQDLAIKRLRNKGKFIKA